MQSLRANTQEQLKNQEAESSWVRRNLWGATESGNSEQSESDEMLGHTVLGDVNHPAPIIIQQPAPQPVQQPQQHNNVPALAALVGVLGLGGMGTYLASRDRPEPPPVVAPIEQVPPEFDDESLSIGLGRIDDYQLPKVE